MMASAGEEICTIVCYIPIFITFILIIGVLCLDFKLYRELRQTKVQCSVIRDFLYILVIIQALLMVILAIQNIDILQNMELYQHAASFTGIAFIYVDLVFHICITLGFLYFIRHRNLSDSERRKFVHCKNKPQEEKE